MHAFILPLLLSGLFAAGPSAGARDVKSGLLTRTVKVGGEPGLLPWLLAQRAD